MSRFGLQNGRTCAWKDTNMNVNFFQATCYQRRRVSQVHQRNHFRILAEYRTTHIGNQWCWNTWMNIALASCQLRKWVSLQACTVMTLQPLCSCWVWSKGKFPSADICCLLTFHDYWWKFDKPLATLTLVENGDHIYQLSVDVIFKQVLWTWYVVAFVQLVWDFILILHL
jgi:hypothetical protein